MKRWMSCLTGLALFCTALCAYGDDSSPSDPLARLKALEGEWVAADADDGKIITRFQVVAGGHSVMETLFPGTEMEMLSLYHRDGDRILMTHYCMAGNQPRMVAKAGKDQDSLVFEYLDGTNLDPAKDGHIHEGSIQFVDRDRIKTEWSFFVDGKVANKYGFELVRKRK